MCRQNNVALWLFFDVGETLLSEISFHSARNDGLYQILRSKRKDLTKDQYESCRRKAILSRPGGEASRVRAIAREVLGAQDYYRAVQEYYERFGEKLIEKFELEPNSMFRPYPEVSQVLQYLSKRHSLGIIANQHRNVRKHLENTWNIASYFKFMILSEEVGFRKPDREIFLLALDKARAEPSEAWMIGDRVDTDVGPSRTLGMKAIRVLHDSEMSIIPPKIEEERPDFQFRDLKPLMNLF
ncbi:MAG: HAD family hydrolase [Nitrososphaerota archaeon]|nr:HAD family hydrolase [Nitrososphaerota archaeon]